MCSTMQLVPTCLVFMFSLCIQGNPGAAGQPGQSGAPGEPGERGERGDPGEDGLVGVTVSSDSVEWVCGGVSVIVWEGGKCG